jgi:hypothetical protein
MNYEDLQTKFRALGPDGYYQVGMIAEALDKNTDGFKSIVHFANPYAGLQVDSNGKISGDTNSRLTIVSFPSYASVEEIQRLRDRMIPMPETCEMLQALAEAKELSNILLVIGGTAIGKTFTIKSFVQALYGESTSPLDIYCNAQSDVSELHGMWAPKGIGEREQQLWIEFLDSDVGRSRLESVYEECRRNEDLSEEQRIRITTDYLKKLAQEIGLSSSTTWEYVPGAIERCFSSNFDPARRQFSESIENGKGAPLHIQEVGASSPKFLNALLELGGKNGELTESVQNWREGGKHINRGPDALIVMSTNPDDEQGYQERKPLDKAIYRRTLPLRLPETLSPLSLLMASQRYFCYETGNLPTARPRGCHLELYNYRDEICRPLAAIAASFHGIYVKSLKAGEGKGISSAVVPSIDQVARLASYMLKLQVVNKEGAPDLVETLKRGIDRVYLNGLMNEEKKSELRSSLETVLKGDLLKALFKGTPESVLQNAAKTAMDDQRKREGGYSERTQIEIARGRNRSLRSASQVKRAEIVSSGGIDSRVKEILSQQQ